MKWYVVRVANGKEKKIKDAIEFELKQNSVECLISNMIIPHKKVEQLRKGKIIGVDQLTFPGYIFVECESIDNVEGAIKHINGVYSILKNPLSKREVDRLQENKQDVVIVTDKYYVNEIIKIIDGPFSTFIGTIVSLDNNKQKARLSVYVFGREVMLDLNFSQFIRNVESSVSA
jgi:transcriptional antiterminator NusG